MMELTVTTKVFADYEGGAVEELIIQRAARLLVDNMADEAKKEIRVIVQEQVRDQVADIVSDVIQNPVQITNYLGEPTGKTQSLRELVIAQGQDFMSQIVNPQGRKEYSRDKKWRYLPRAEHLVHEVVNSEFDRMFADEIKQAVEAVRAEMDNHLEALTRIAIKKLLDLKD